MHRSPVINSLWLSLLAALLLGCSVDPEARLVGKWKGDDSAVGVAMKAAKFKADNPEMEGSAAMAAARKMGATTLDLSADKSCALFMGGNTLKGKWALVKEDNVVELNLETAEIPPENKEQNPEGFKPQQFVAVLNEGGDQLEVLPFDRASYKVVLDATKGKKRQKFMVLSKE